MRTARRAAVVLVSALVAIQVTSLVTRVRLPEVTGPLGVGFARLSWTDDARPELNTADPNDRREIVAEVWYPAVRDSGTPAPYVPDLDRIGGALVDSGEVPALAAAGLRLVGTPARLDAEFASASERYPVILLSPGNATNAQFYAGLATELASNGYVVVGLEHPYQVTAVALSGGRVATYREQLGPVTPRIAERVDDVRSALDLLHGIDRGGHRLSGRLDLSKVGIIGHSNGGLAAVEACKADARVHACVNVDGQAAGGPFSTSPDGRAPSKPFMYLTKERAINQVILERFEAAGTGTFRVVIPRAQHHHFVDTALFAPVINPFDRTAEHVIRTTRGLAVAFFDHALRGAPRSVLGRVRSEIDIFVNVHPLGANPPIPAH